MESFDDPKPSLAYRVLGGARALQTTFRDLDRIREISVVLGSNGFDTLAGLLRRKDARPRATDASETFHELSRPDRAQRVLKVVQELGTTFVKFGQILSTRPDVIPADIVEALSTLQDRVPPMSWEEAEAVLTTELGAPPETVFREISKEALASASIAQVHRVTLHSGEEAVVKIQRPGIVPKVQADLHILHSIARRMHTLMPELELVDPVGIVTEFAKALLRELDFTHEREHILRFRQNFEGFEGIVIPRVYDDFCTERVLTMEYICGWKATEAAPHIQVDSADIAPRMVRAVFKMIFEDGYFHGDLHPGNVLVQEDGTIGLIDFGLVGKLSPSQRDNILDILIGISRKDYPLVARVFYEIGQKVPGTHYNYQRFEDDVVALMETHIGDRNISEINVGAYFSDIVAGAIRHNIKMPPTYTMVFKALMTVEGMGKQLAPDVNFVNEALPFIREVLIQRYSPARLLRDGVDLFSSTARFMRGVPSTAVQVLDDLSRGSLTVRVRSTDLDHLIRAQQNDARLLATALTTVGFSLVGVLAWELGEPVALGLSVPSFIFFSIATLAGIVHLWRILRGRV